MARNSMLLCFEKNYFVTLTLSNLANLLKINLKIDLCCAKGNYCQFEEGFLNWEQIETTIFNYNDPALINSTCVYVWWPMGWINDQSIFSWLNIFFWKTPFGSIKIYKIEAGWGVQSVHFTWFSVYKFSCYSGVHISSDEVFSKILKKQSIVQK